MTSIGGQFILPGPVCPSACRPSTRVDERDVVGWSSLHRVWRESSLHACGGGIARTSLSFHPRVVHQLVLMSETWVGGPPSTACGGRLPSARVEGGLPGPVCPFHLRVDHQLVLVSEAWVDDDFPPQRVGGGFPPHVWREASLRTCGGRIALTSLSVPSACRPSTRVDERDVGGRRLPFTACGGRLPSTSVKGQRFCLHNVWSENVHDWFLPSLAC